MFKTQRRGVRIFNPIESGLRTKFEFLKVSFSW